MIDFEHVTKIYKRSDKPALEDIDFHVADGEFVFLVGHSGAGKSTLLKLILREELPTEGRVLVDGKDVARLRRGKVPYLRRQMGIIFQDFRLIPTMTVYENIAFAMHVTNIGKKDIKERVNYMLELVHLEDKAKVYPEFLSGGEQQRVAVARALAHSPRLVIADEPTGNIDPEMSLEMMELLERVSEMLFDALLENSFIQSRWQNVLGKGAFLQSKDGTRSVSVSTLSSALSSIKNNMTSVAYSIRKVIDRLKE